MRLRHWLTISAVFLICTGWIAAQQAASKKFAVLVGVNEYQHEKLSRLKYAEQDVLALEKLLKDGGYEVQVLTGSNPDVKKQATKAVIEKEVAAVLNKCAKGDLVVLAFAGHGLQFESHPDAFFCPSDARPFKDATDSLVSLSGIYRQLERSFAGMKVLLVDACRNDPDAGRGARGGIDADNAPRPPKGVAALFSCQAGERAFETDQLQHGVFFYHVLQGLKGEANDRRGQVTFAGLASYVSQEVSVQVPKMIGGGAKQSPNLKADYSNEPLLLVHPSISNKPSPTNPTNVAIRKPFVGTTSPFPMDVFIRSVRFAKNDEWIVTLARGDGDENVTGADNVKTSRPRLFIWDGYSGELVKNYMIRAGVS